MVMAFVDYNSENRLNKSALHSTVCFCGCIVHIQTSRIQCQMVYCIMWQAGYVLHAVYSKCKWQKTVVERSGMATKLSKMWSECPHSFVPSCCLLTSKDYTWNRFIVPNSYFSFLCVGYIGLGLHCTYLQWSLLSNLDFI